MAAQAESALNTRFKKGGSSTVMPRTPHCQRWHTVRHGNGDQVNWACGFCRNALMRVSRRPGEEGTVGAYHDVAPCEQAMITLQNPMHLKPNPVKRAQTKTGIATPEYPWPIESANLDGLVAEGLGHGDRTKGYVKPKGYKPEKYWNQGNGGQHQAEPPRQSAQRPATPRRAAATAAAGAASSSQGPAPPPPPVAQTPVQMEAVDERSSSTKRRSIFAPREAETAQPTVAFVNTSTTAGMTAPAQATAPKSKAVAPPSFGPQSIFGQPLTWPQPPNVATQEGSAKTRAPSQVRIAELEAALQVAQTRLASTSQPEAFAASSAPPMASSGWMGPPLIQQSAAQPTGIHVGSPEAPNAREASHDTNTSSEFEILNDPAWRGQPTQAETMADQAARAAVAAATPLPAKEKRASRTPSLGAPVSRGILN